MRYLLKDGHFIIIFYDRGNKNNNETPSQFLTLFYLLLLLHQNSIYSAFIRKGTIFDTLLLFVRAPRAQKRMSIECANQIEIRIVQSLPRNPRDRKSTACPTYTTTAANKMSDTFYLLRANGTIGALTLRFPPQTSEDRRKRRTPEGWFSRWKRRWSGSDRGFSPLGIRRGLDCISWHTYSFADTFA